MSGRASANGRPHAVVIDAGVGNLGNLERALRHVGASVEITDRAESVAAGRCLLLPGVGAFRPPRERLRGELEAALRAALESGAHLLGICVGYQLLFAGSSEFGDTDGLGLLEGSIDRLPESVPLPHIGWNALHDLAAHPLLAGIEEGSYAYFVHSYAPDGVLPGSTLARATHGRAFAAIAGSGRILGTQFHPEKSAGVGLRLLANYLEICGS
jgi:glutamine amidotransferase